MTGNVESGFEATGEPETSTSEDTRTAGARTTGARRADARTADARRADTRTADARAALVEKLHAAWARSGLKQQSVEARLKTMLSGQNVRGLSDTALSRYLKPDETALPADAVLTALAHIFQVGEEERAEWHDLRRRAKADQRRLRYQRTAPGRTSPAPGPDPAGPSAPAAGSGPGEPGLHPDAPEAPDAPDAFVAPGGDDAGSGEPDGRDHSASGGPGPAAGDDPGRARQSDRSSKKAKAVAVATAALATLLAGGVLAGAALWGRDTADKTVVPDAASETTVPGSVTAVPGALEKGSIGVDSRCSEPFQGPEAVVWRVCARVEEERVSFALKVTNQGRAGTMVKIRLEYARSSRFHPCPKAPRAHLLDVPAGETVVTEPGLCALPRQDAYVAYQGVGWVVAEHANAGSYELSPTAHVRPDRVIWKPDLV
ncbi:hypothetical protein [Streptomyces sp. NPDC095613]|uniref:hypothetical protein n=1 Tax=Streptomyces sp. NPDC095613 TaxID=3155540 RepID=UPI00331EF828